MNCPRCNLPLEPVTYEGVETDMCDACWGFWLDSGELEEVLESRELEFSDEEKEAILEVQGGSSPPQTDPASCPKCGETMKRLHFHYVVVDGCRQHGVWLDTGEIKRVQALAEKSDSIHRMLIRKFGLGSTEA